MLVLTRKKDENIRIDDDIVIKIVEINSHSVRLGIVADGKSVKRDEVWLRIQAEKNALEASKAA